MKTLTILARLAINGTIAIAAFILFILLELFVMGATIDLLISDHGMDPAYSKYIWFFCYAVIAIEVVMFCIRVLFRGIKNFFKNLA
jgi:hypothetical protein